MTAVSGAIPNLIGGVSQQPHEIRAANTADFLMNSVSDVTVGLTTRNGATHLSTLGNIPASGNVATHIIQKPRGDFLVVATEDDMYVVNLKTGAQETVTFQDASARSYITSTESEKHLGFYTVADTSFVYNRDKTVEVLKHNESGLTGRDEGGTPRRNPGRYGTIWVKQRAGYLAHYIGYYKGNKIVDVETDEATPKVIANNFDSAFTAAGIPASKPSSTVVSLEFPDESGYVEVSDDLANQALISFNEYIEEWTDLPNFDRTGRLVEIRQTRADPGDDYWVIRKRGRWQETYGWDAYEEPIPSTWPHVLVDNLDGTWTLKRHEWKPRLVGDAKSNKTPSFVNQKINYMWVYKGRMGILAGEHIVFSEVGEFENFYRSSCSQLLDDDRIDISSTSGVGAPLMHVKQFNDALLVFSPFSQYMVAGDRDGLLSPNNVNIKPVNSFRCARHVAPVYAGPNVVFIDDFSNKRYATVREYQVERTFGTQVAPSITDHVPEFIPSGVYKITESSSDDVMALLTKKQKDKIFLYNYYHNSEGKVQSSWQKWDLNCEIFNVDFSDDNMILVVNYLGKLMVLSVSFIMGASDIFNGDDILLDFKLTNEEILGVTVTSDAAGKPISRVQLPWNVASDEKWGQYRLVITPDNTGPLTKAQTYTPVAVEGDKLLFEGINVTGNQYHVGKTFVFEWKLNRIYNRDQNQVAIQDGKLMLRGVSFLYSGSGPFTVTTTPEKREDYKQRFSGIRVGQGETNVNNFRLEHGEFRASAYGEAATTSVRVTARTPWRVRFTSVEWDGAVRLFRKRTT